ncbi:MAG: hypothetical protein HYZ42_10205, partial [Bacteroidetes bacterium]|nr:hypothetical protein [Bacteroidota bacterium]
MNIIKWAFSLVLVSVFSDGLFAQQFDDYMSEMGVGLYFKQVIKKNTTLKLKSKNDLTGVYNEFYEDQYTKKIYIRNHDGVISLEDALNTKPVKNTASEIYSLDPDLGVGTQRSSVEPFIKQNLMVPGITLEMPQHHLSKARLQALKLNRPNFNLELVLSSIN